MKLNVREAAAMLNVRETKLYRWVDDGEIPFVTIQHRPLFHRLELLEWAMEQNVPISVDLYDDPADAPFATALERGGGHLMTAGGLPQVVDDLPIDPADRDVIRAVIAARGREMFHVRDGIAIPTPRSPLICPDLEPAVMLWWCRAREVTIDETSTGAVFAIAAPTVRDHLQLLSRLALVIRDEMFRRAVQQAHSFANVVAEARRVEQRIEAARAGKTST